MAGRVPLMATIARDVMNTDPDCVSHTDTVEEVAMRMRSLLVAFLPVCDEDGYLCGIVGYRDIGAQARSARGEIASVTAASLVASELTNANSPLHESALIEIALVLFGITLLLNLFARLLVWQVSRGPAGARV